MPSARSRSLLTLVAGMPLVSGCFLSGHYSVDERTVSVAPETTDEARSSQGDSPSDVTPTSLTVAPPAPTLTDGSLGSSVTSSEPSSSAEPSTTGLVGTSTDEATPTTSEGNASSAPTSDASTDAGQGSEGRGSSGDRCERGDCAEPCGEDEVRGPQGKCYWFGASQGTWEQAKTACANRGSNWVPITIHDEEEDDFVAAQVDRVRETWIGAQYDKGVWRWLDDNTAFWNGTGPRGMQVAGVFHNWGFGEPSGLNGETCGRVWSFSGDMRWGDGRCNELKLFACQSPTPTSN